MATVNDTQPNPAGNGPKQSAALQQSRKHDPATRSEGAAVPGLRTGGRAEVAHRIANPFETLWQMSREIDRLMGSAFGGLVDPAFGSHLHTASPEAHPAQRQAEGSWAPQIDVEQRPDAVVVRADLPGVNKEDINVEVSDETLIIRGERREDLESSDSKTGVRSYERSYGTFYRSIPLPQHASVENLNASLRNGVLTVTAPLDERARPRRINIEN